MNTAASAANPIQAPRPKRVGACISTALLPHARRSASNLATRGQKRWQVQESAFLQVPCLFYSPHPQHRTEKMRVDHHLLRRMLETIEACLEPELRLMPE